MTPEQMVAAKWHTMRQADDQFAVMATHPGTPMETVVTTDCWGLSEHIAWTHNIQVRGSGVTYDESILRRPVQTIAEKYRPLLEMEWVRSLFKVYAFDQNSNKWQLITLSNNMQVSHAIAHAHNKCRNYMFPIDTHRAMQREYVDSIIKLIGQQISSW